MLEINLPIYVEAFLVEYVIPLELVHQTELEEERTEEVEDGLGVRVVQHLLGEDHPLFELNCSLYVEVCQLQHVLVREALLQLGITGRLVEVESSTGFLLRELRQHSKQIFCKFDNPD